MTYIRIRYKKLGGHYYCRVFSSQMVDGTYAKNGDLVFDEREWPQVCVTLGLCELINDAEAT